MHNNKPHSHSSIHTHTHTFVCRINTFRDQENDNNGNNIYTPLAVMTIMTDSDDMLSMMIKKTKRNVIKHIYIYINI